jgi:hypothetical protein
VSYTTTTDGSPIFGPDNNMERECGARGPRLWCHLISGRPTHQLFFVLERIMSNSHDHLPISVLLLVVVLVVLVVLLVVLVLRLIVSWMRYEDEDDCSIEETAATSSTNNDNNSNNIAEDKKDQPLLSDHHHQEDDDDDSFASSSSLSWNVFSSLAIFGDSSAALTASFVLLVLAIGVSFWMDQPSTVQSLFQPPLFQPPPTSPTMSLQLQQEEDSSIHNYAKLGPIPMIDPPHIFEINTCHNNDKKGHPELPTSSSLSSSILLAEEMRISFEKDGVIAIRGLLPPELLDRLDAASHDLVVEEIQKKRAKPTAGFITGRKLPRGTQFHTVDIGTIFRESTPFTPTTTTTTSAPVDTETSHHSINNDDNDTKALLQSPFLDVALLSQIPAVAAELLQLDAVAAAATAAASATGSNNTNNITMRLLRDIFLAKDDDEYICGWHVDDHGFWPAVAEAPGVNAWIALDDMPEHGGGGFALAVGSHDAPWNDEAYYVTGAPQYFPTHGFRNAADFFTNRTGSGTCNIQTAAPHLHRRMEETKRVYNVQRGDVIFHTRWLFHRTVAFEPRDAAEVEIEEDEEENKGMKKKAKKNRIYRRLSLRYGPGSSIIPPGFGTELSVLWDKQNGGRTADEVSLQDGPWYPQVWPSVSTDELHQLKDLIRRKLPVAEQRRDAVQKQMRPYRKQAKNRRQPH